MYDREVNLPIKINIMNVRVKVIDKSDKNRIFVDAIFTNQKNLNRLLKTINDKYGKNHALGLSEVTDLITDWKKDTVYCVRKFNKYNLSIVLTGTTNIGNWKYFNMELLTNKK